MGQKRNRKGSQKIFQMETLPIKSCRMLQKHSEKEVAEISTYFKKNRKSSNDQCNFIPEGTRKELSIGLAEERK